MGCRQTTTPGPAGRARRALLWLLVMVALPLLAGCDIDLPYSNGFESKPQSTKGETVGGEKDWQTRAHWKIVKAASGWRSRSGLQYLDSNPKAERFRGRSNLEQAAVLEPLVFVAADAQRPFLSFWHKLVLADAEDRFLVQVLTDERGSWQTIAAYSQADATGDYAEQVVSLHAFRGKALMIRFTQDFPRRSDGLRRWAIDDLRLYDAPPEPVRELDARQDGTAVALRWAAPEDSASVDAYRVYRQAVGETDYTELTDLLLSATEYRDGSVLNGIGYRYKVVAVDGQEREGEASLAQVFVAYNQDRVGGLAVDWAGNAADLKWNPVADRRYRIYRAAQAGGEPAPIGDVAAARYSDPALATDQGYRYWVSTVAEFTNPFTDERFSLEAERVGPVTLAPLFPAVQGLRAQLHGEAVALEWAAVGSPRLAGYDVYRAGPADQDWIRITAEPTRAAQYTDPAVANGSGYRYRVVAVDAGRYPGVASEPAPIFVAYNRSSVQGISLGWDGNAAVLAWEPLPNRYFRVYRAPEASGEPTRIAEVADTGYRDAGLATEQAHRYWVSAVADFRNPFTGEQFSLEAPLQGPLLLTPLFPAVQGVQATLQHESVALSWQPAVSPALAGYDVFRASPTGEDWARLTAAPVTAATFVDAAVVNGAGYRYRVVAVDAARNPGVPSAPVAFFVAYNRSAAGDLQVQWSGDTAALTWAPAVSRHYRVYRAPEADGEPELLGGVTANRYDDAGLATDLGYRYWVSTVADFTDPFTGQSFSLESDKTGPARLAALFPAAQGLQASLEGEGVALSWTAVAATRLAGYDVYRAAATGEEWLRLTETPVTATAYRDDTAENGQGYRYRVVAVDAERHGGVGSAPQPFFVAFNHDAVTALAVAWDGNAGSLQWGAVADRHYRIYRAPLGGGAPARIAESDTAGFTDPGLGTDQSYRYWVSTVADFTNPFTEERFSLEAERVGPVTLNPLFAAVQGLQAQLSGEMVNLGWSAIDSSGLAGYDVYRAIATGDEWTRLTATPVAGTQYTDGSVLNGSGYRYRVVAVDGARNPGVASAPAAIFVAYNHQGVQGVGVVREGWDARLTWNGVSGMRYRLFRDSDGNAEPTPLIDVDSASHLDPSPGWQQPAYYRVALIAGFTNVFTGEALRLVGPASAPVTLAALAPLQLELGGLTGSAAAGYEVVWNGEAQRVVGGQYRNAVGAVEVRAVSASGVVRVESTSGAFSLSLPQPTPETWTVTLSELGDGSRNASVELRILADTGAPQLSVSTPSGFSTTEEIVAIDGFASDAESGIARVSIVSDQHELQVFEAVLGEGNRFFAEVPLAIGMNTLTVIAADRAGNQTSAELTVERRPIRPGPVVSLQGAQQGTGVALGWQPPVDGAPAVGYNVYRQAVGETDFLKLNSGWVSALGYTDAAPTNGTGYRYKVVAVDDYGRESEERIAEVFVAYNTFQVQGLSASREGWDGRLSWSAAAGLRFQIFRSAGSDGDFAQLGEIEGAGYLDVKPGWQQPVYYRVKTVASFTNVFTDERFTLVGELSDPAELAPLGALAITLDGLNGSPAGGYEVVWNGQSQLSVSGLSLGAVGALNVRAVAGGTTASAQSSNGSFQLMLPTSQPNAWTITASEQAEPARSSAIELRILPDTVPPSLEITGAADRATSGDSLAIEGFATDGESGLASVTIGSDRYAGNSFQATLGDNGRFYAEVPLLQGANILTVRARDRVGNESTGAVTVQRQFNEAPKITIAAPANNSVTASEAVTVSGVIYTSQSADKLKVTLGTRQFFPSAGATAGAYGYAFDNVRLNTGSNLLTVTVESPAGADQASVVVTRDANETPVESTPPVLTITSPAGTGFVNDAQVTVAGSASSSAGIASVTVNGFAVVVGGSLSKSVSFQRAVDVTGAGADITVIATDTAGLATSRTIRIQRDVEAPAIGLAGGLQPAPAISSVMDNPYRLQGTVTDANLAGLTINDRSVGLIPGASAGLYQFDALISLQSGQDQALAVEAWDQAGNRVRRDLVLRLDASAGIEIIAPDENAELQADGEQAAVEVIVRLLGSTEGLTAHGRIGSGASAPLTLASGMARGEVITTAEAGERELVVELRDGADSVVARSSRRFKIANLDDLELEATRIVPATGAAGIEPNEPISVFFNKPIDPALLSISVTETVHGLTYDLGGLQGTEALRMGASLPIVEVHRDQAPVGIKLSILPDKRAVVVYLGRELAYGANAYVDVRYDGSSLVRSNFSVRPLPTFLSGAVVDQAGNPVEGLTVSLPTLKQSAVTDINGTFSLGFQSGDEATLPPGLHRLVVNPGLANMRFGSVEQWANLEAGRYNRLPPSRVPRLNPERPFQRLNSGQHVVLAGGELELDLTQARLTFPDGRSSGDVHVQFMLRGDVPYAAQPAANPSWLFGLQPMGIEVSGPVGLAIAAPAVHGTHEYLPPDDTLVLLVGRHASEMRLVPVGVGRVQSRRIYSVGELALGRLDYLGYVVMDPKHQELLGRYRDGLVSLDAVSAVLDR